MRKKIVMIGLIIFVVGVVLFFGGGDLGLHGLVKTETMTESSTGVYQSPSFTVLSGNLTIVTSEPGTTLYIIHSSDSYLVNASNVKQYAITGGTTSNTSGVSTLAFTSMSAGTYTIVSVSTSNAIAKITLTNEADSSLIFSLLPTILGIMLGFVGFVMLIIGLILKNKTPPLPDAAY